MCFFTVQLRCNDVTNNWSSKTVHNRGRVFFFFGFFLGRGWFICRLMAGFVTISRVKFSHLLNILRSHFKAGARTGVHWETKELQAVYICFFPTFAFIKGNSRKPKLQLLLRYCHMNEKKILFSQPNRGCHSGQLFFYLKSAWRFPFSHIPAYLFL